VDIAANGQRHASGPRPFASYTSPYDNTWNAVDGIVYRYGIPENSRWTSYASTNASDSYGVDFGRNQKFSDVRLTFYDDGGGVRLPSSYDLQYWTGSTWVTVPGQTRSPAAPARNGLTRITFPALTTSKLRVVAPNAGGGTGWGLSEFEVWAAPVFQIVNVNSGKLLAVQNASTADSANVQQYNDNGSTDHLWQLVDAGGGWYKIVNVNSGKVLAVRNASTALSAQIQQYSDNGTPDHLWRLADAGNGQYKIINRNSGLLLGVSGASTADSANVVQYADNGTTDHLWILRSAAAP
jgi:hypothetical protein